MAKTTTHEKDLPATTTTATPTITVTVPTAYVAKAAMILGQLLSFRGRVFRGWDLAPGIKAASTDCVWLNVAGVRGDTPNAQIQPDITCEGGVTILGYTDQPRGRKVYTYHPGAITIGLSDDDMKAVGDGRIPKSLAVLCRKVGDGVV